MRIRNIIREVKKQVPFALVGFVIFLIVASTMYLALQPYFFPYQISRRRVVLLDGGVPAEEVNVENTTIYVVHVPDALAFILRWIVDRAWPFLLFGFFVAFLEIRGEEQIVRWGVRIGVTAQWANVIVFLYMLKIGAATAGALASLIVGWIPFIGDAITSAIEQAGEAIEAAILFTQFLYMIDLTITTFLTFTMYWVAKYILRLFGPKIMAGGPIGFVARLLAGAFVLYAGYYAIVKPILQLIATLTWGLVQIP